MIKFNCIVVYNKEKTKLLFCKRIKNPYRGLYNLVGGKVEKNEQSEVAAYRELNEETGISNKDIKLVHIMDFIYYEDPCIVEVYAGILNKDVELISEIHPLIWIDSNENFFNLDDYAGEGNIGHMIIHAKYVLKI